MEKLIIFMAVLVSVVVFSGGEISAENLNLRYEKKAVITSPTKARDSRILIYFRLPALLSRKDVRIDYAKLVFEADVQKHPLGLVNISPVTTSWKDAAMINWKGLWEKDGGDFSSDLIHAATVKESKSKKQCRLDITDIVLSWLDGVLNNEGLIIMPSKSMLEESPVECNIDSKDIKLVINYTKDDIERRLKNLPEEEK